MKKQKTFSELYAEALNVPNLTGYNFQAQELLRNNHCSGAEQLLILYNKNNLAFDYANDRKFGAILDKLFAIN